MKNENHSGTCSFCHTTVPQVARVCTGCGAFWGLSNGKNRIDQVRAFTFQYRLGQVVVLGAVLGMLYAYFKAGDSLMWWIFSVLLFLSGAQVFSGAAAQISLGKRGELKWWRRQ